MIAMLTIRLDAEITEDGHLKVELPDGLPVGKVQIALEIPETPWTDEELAALMKPEPMTGAEIVAAGLTGGWRDLDIPDGATWVEEQRRKRKERRNW
jgi:hypothetical protein